MLKISWFVYVCVCVFVFLQRLWTRVTQWIWMLWWRTSVPSSRSSAPSVSLAALPLDSDWPVSPKSVRSPQPAAVTALNTRAAAAEVLVAAAAAPAAVPAPRPHLQSEWAAAPADPHWHPTSLWMTSQPSWKKPPKAWTMQPGRAPRPSLLQSQHRTLPPPCGGRPPIIIIAGQGPWVRSPSMRCGPLSTHLALALTPLLRPAWTRWTSINPNLIRMGYRADRTSQVQR